MQSTTTDTAASQELAVIETVNLELMERADAPAIWGELKAKFEQLKASVESVIASDPSVPANAKIARVNRLELRQIRIAVESKRKELGEGLLRKKQSIDNAARDLKNLIEPYESQLLAIEDHAERVEAERLRKLSAERVEKLTKYTIISGAVDYGALSDDEFEKMLSDAKTLHELKQAEAKRQEEQRIAREKAEAEDRERMRLENERLKREAEEREKQLAAERVETERKAKEAAEIARKEREAIEAKAAEEKAKADAIAKQEREAREKIEAENRKREEAEANKAEAERLAQEEAELAPDREKLAVFAAAIRALPIPTITSEMGKKAIALKIEEFAQWVETNSKNLKGSKK